MTTLPPARAQQPDREILASREEWFGFLSGLTHELRTPLGSLLMLSELLDEGGADPAAEKRRRHARRLRETADDLLALVNQAGELNRILAGRNDPGTDEVQVGDLLARLAERHDSGRGGLRLTVRREPDAASTLSEGGRALERILDILVGSSLRAPGAREVSLEVRPERRDSTILVAFEVSDDGEPMPPEEHEAILLPFGSTGPRSSREHGGTSLLLPIARALAGTLGGSLEVETRGARTVLRLLVPTSD